MRRVDEEIYSKTPQLEDENLLYELGIIWIDDLLDNTVGCLEREVNEILKERD